MGTISEPTTAPAPDSFASHVRHCAHCGLPYDWRRSASSSLKMTYCGSLCEKADLGFMIESLLQAERSPWGAFIAQAAWFPVMPSTLIRRTADVAYAQGW